MHERGIEARHHLAKKCGIGGDEGDRAFGGAGADGIDKFIGRGDAFIAIERARARRITVDAEIKLAAASVEHRNQNRRTRRRLRRNGFERADSGDGLRIHFAPTLGRRESHAQAGEGAWPGGNRKKIEVFQPQRQVLQQKIEMAEEARRIIFEAARGDDAEKRLIAQGGDAASKRGSVKS